jgi:hypothetical protein
MIYRIFTKHNIYDYYGKTYFVLANNINDAQKAVLEVLSKNYSIHSTHVDADKDDVVLDSETITNIKVFDPIENYFKCLSFIDKLKLLFGGKI